MISESALLRGSNPCAVRRKQAGPLPCSYLTMLWHLLALPSPTPLDLMYTTQLLLLAPKHPGQKQFLILVSKALPVKDPCSKHLRPRGSPTPPSKEKKKTPGFIQNANAIMSSGHGTVAMCKLVCGALVPFFTCTACLPHPNTQAFLL